MIGEIGNSKMKKILLVLLFIPAFIYGQDTPLIEQKVTTEKMEKEDQKKKDKALYKDEKHKESSQITRDGKQDAKLHYHYKHCGRNLTGIISAIYPIAGLVPAISYSLSEPLDKNLNYPSQESMNRQEYNKAYKKQAHRMKKRRVWVMFGLGTLINLGIWTIIDNNN